MRQGDSGFLRFVVAFAVGAAARPRTTLALCLAMAAACGLLAMARLGVSTNQNDLFSARAPFFRDYLRYIREFPENEALYVLIEASGNGPTPPPERWTALADSVSERVRSLAGVAESVDARVPLDQLGNQGILFERPDAIPDRISDAARFVPFVRLFAEAPSTVATTLGASPIERFLSGMALTRPDDESLRLLSVLAESWADTLEKGTGDDPAAVMPDLRSLAVRTPADLGYYFVPDESDPTQRVLLIRVYLQRDFTSLTAVSRQVEAVRRTARSAAESFPEFRVGVTGRPALEADEMTTTERDTRRAELAAITTAFFALMIILKSVRLAVAAVASIGIAIIWTLGFATVVVGHLNLLSMVFLIALIGIGMDYMAQVLARYRALVDANPGRRETWRSVFGQVAAPITTACCGAAGAFYVSTGTDFRGAAELGLIAGTGLLLCLLASYTALPALATLLAGKARGSVVPPRPSPPARPPQSLRTFALPVAWFVALAVLAPFAMRVRFDPGLINLQAQNVESVQLVNKLQTWSAAVMTDDLAALKRARDALAGSPYVARTESVLDAMDNHDRLHTQAPGPESIRWAEPPMIPPNSVEPLQRRASAIAARLRAGDAADPEREGAIAALDRFATALGTDPPARAAAGLSAWQVRFADLLRRELGQFRPSRLELSALPRELRDHLISPGGMYALYVYPRENLWERGALLRFVGDVESRIGDSPGTLVTGIAHNIAHSTNSIESAFYGSTLAALGLVFVLVLADMRRLSRTLLAVSVLALGLPMLAGIMGATGASWNFANFFALPIIIGAGHEYGVFLVHRYLEARRDPLRAWKGWDASDNGLLLCAILTSASFGFFWLTAHHQGLRSLGMVIAVGTACIYLSGLLVLRPLLRWRLERSPPGV